MKNEKKMVLCKLNFCIYSLIHLISSWRLKTVFHQTLCTSGCKHGTFFFEFCILDFFLRIYSDLFLFHFEVRNLVKKKLKNAHLKAKIVKFCLINFYTQSIHRPCLSNVEALISDESFFFDVPTNNI